MRSKGTAVELEHRRILAVQRVLEGYAVEEVADFLGVDPRSVRRWTTAFRTDGVAALAAKAGAGRPPKLTYDQEKIVRRWLRDSPTAFGFATDLWTGPRLAQLIRQEWDIVLHPRYLTAWLRVRGFSPQRPQRVPRERNEDALVRWLAQDWPRIKKRPGGRTPASP